MAGETVNSIDMLRKLVAFDTTSRNSNLALIEYVQKYLEGHGVASKLVPSEDGKKANLFATVGPMVKDGVAFTLMVLVLWLKPAGLLGRARVSRA